ncbi:hypothetical protein E2562_003831 [Oryza meyeriana var. granulata]|uniref:Uncharacterized protein n=1 Tax=Oryza meyeriana var. granulata TaxID=110450 RepID=A0A6G1CZA3_9ORYZ|nr:hypothetical protein E2562_003831 [Oryza meyeriana var. granulata]
MRGRTARGAGRCEREALAGRRRWRPVADGGGQRRGRAKPGNGRNGAGDGLARVAMAAVGLRRQGAESGGN